MSTDRSWLSWDLSSVSRQQVGSVQILFPVIFLFRVWLPFQPRLSTNYCTPLPPSTTRPPQQLRSPQNSARISSKSSTMWSWRIRTQRRLHPPQYHQYYVSSFQDSYSAHKHFGLEKSTPAMGLSASISIPQRRTTSAVYIVYLAEPRKWKDRYGEMGTSAQWGNRWIVKFEETGRSGTPRSRPYSCMPRAESGLQRRAHDGVEFRGTESGPPWCRIMQLNSDFRR